jgi:hypothetical protein
MKKVTKDPNAVETINDGTVGRPIYKVAFPQKKFTMDDLFELNGCNSTPPRMCKLTVIKAKDNALKGDSSFIVKTPDLVPNPSGKGRKRFVFVRRSRYEAGKRLAAQVKSTVTVDVAETPETVTA